MNFNTRRKVYRRVSPGQTRPQRKMRRRATCCCCVEYTIPSTWYPAKSLRPATGVIVMENLFNFKREIYLLPRIRLPLFTSGTAKQQTPKRGSRGAAAVGVARHCHQSHRYTTRAFLIRGGILYIISTRFSLCDCV